MSNKFNEDQLSGMTRDEARNLLLASIAMEELELASLINAEASRVHAVVDTFSNGEKTSPIF